MPYFEMAIVLLLILVNGFFAMSEMAIVSARRGRLARLASEGDRGARRALALIDDPSGFLSAVQIGITLIGIFAGAYSGTTFAEPLADWLRPWFGTGAAVQNGAFAVVVAVTTYLSLVIGELVPKRVALNRAEHIARLVSGPMTFVATLGFPLVWFLRRSVNGVLRLLGLRAEAGARVTEEDVRSMIIHGTKIGVFEPAEREMMEGVMRTADRAVHSIMVPRHEVVWFSLDDELDVLLDRIGSSGHARYPVCRGSLDEVVGILHANDLLAVAGRDAIDLAVIVHEPLYVSETMPILGLIDRLRETRAHIAIVLDEYGSVEGLVTPTDVLTAIAGDLPTGEAAGATEVAQRPDGSFLVDGGLAVGDLDRLVPGIPSPPEGSYRTVAGFVLDEIGHIPSAGESFEWQGWKLEVIDMDGRRIDKVLAVPPAEGGEDGQGS